MNEIPEEQGVRNKRQLNISTWLPIVITIAGMIWVGASSIQSKFDVLDKRQSQIEDKLDTFMAAFDVKYQPRAK
jgi:hypothetical protein